MGIDTRPASFAELDQQFLDRDAQLPTGSTDSEFVHAVAVTLEQEQGLRATRDAAA